MSNDQVVGVAVAENQPSIEQVSAITIIGRNS